MCPNAHHACEVELQRTRHSVTAISGRNFDINTPCKAQSGAADLSALPCLASDTTSISVSRNRYYAQCPERFSSSKGVSGASSKTSIRDLGSSSRSLRKASRAIRRTSTSPQRYQTLLTSNACSRLGSMEENTHKPRT